MKFRKIQILTILLLPIIFGSSFAQQNHSLFFMHHLPESNLLNPAVPIPCKWYIGIPVLSSTHFNYGNSSFTYNQLFTTSGNGTYEATIDNVVKQLHRRNYIGTELHTQLFALGYRTGDYSFMFTITEKNNLSITYPKKAIMLLWNGNSQFAGESASFKGTGVFLNHYREYAFSASKYSKDGIYFGARAKLLFGKLNVSPQTTDISLTTDETTFNLLFEGDLNVRSSLPINIESNNNRVGDVAYNDAVSPMSLIFNRKNPGFAMDFGIIYPFTENIEISASLLDLGFIRWRSNLNTIEGNGEFAYEGFLIDTVNPDSYFNDLINSFADSMEVNVSHEKYTTFLPPRIIIGGSYELTNSIKAGVQSEIIIHKSKIIPSATISAHYNPANSLQLMASYTIQYYSLKTLGLGFVVGRNPVQFYMISDNVLGAIWPMSTRNINLRFGLNINLGCKIKEEKPGGGKGMLSGNCYWLEKSIQKNKQKEDRKKDNKGKRPRGLKQR